MDDKNVYELEKASNRNSCDFGTKMIEGIHNYDILSNPTYIDRLQYVPCVLRTEDEILIRKYR